MVKWLSYDTVNVESGFRLPLAPPDLGTVRTPYPKPGGIVGFFPSQKITSEKLTTLQEVQCVSSNVIGAPVGEPEMGVPITISQSKPGHQFRR